LGRGEYLFFSFPCFSAVPPFYGGFGARIFYADDWTFLPHRPLQVKSVPPLSDLFFERPFARFLPTLTFFVPRKGFLRCTILLGRKIYFFFFEGAFLMHFFFAWRSNLGLPGNPIAFPRGIQPCLTRSCSHLFLSFVKRDVSPFPPRVGNSFPSSVVFCFFFERLRTLWSFFVSFPTIKSISPLPLSVFFPFVHSLLD